MKPCYLVNQYPKVSHSFIRREILELERQGCEVLRIALRGWEQRVVDPEDLEEQARTRYVLRGGVLGLVAAMLRESARSPVRFLRTLAVSLQQWRASDKSLAKHLACLAEACVATGWIRAQQTSHIHAHFGTNSAEVAMLASSLSGVTYSFTVHGPEEFDHPAGLCLGEKIRRAAAVVAISSYGRSQLYRWSSPADWSKVMVVHCGLDNAFLEEPAHGSPEPATFVCVGRLCEQKGQLLLLDALRQLIDQGHACRIVLAGDGELRGAVEQRLRELRLEEHVTITGWIDSQRVKQEILAARALVLPSFAEGLPVVIMESLALSRPVITTFVAGIPELVVDGQCGWLVPAGDTAELTRAMADCLARSDDALHAMGQNGRQRVLQRHAIATEAAKLLNLFRTIS